VTDSPAAIVRQLLIDRGIGSDIDTSLSWPVQVGMEPEQPDDVITVYDVAGPNEQVMQGRLIGPADLQIRVRSSKRKLGFSKCIDIATELSQRVLNQLVNVDGNQYLVVCVSEIASPNPLGKADSQRTVHTMSCTVSVRSLQ